MRDRLRVWATILAALFQIVVPVLGYAGVVGRTTGAEFQTAKTPLVPAAYAFSLWSVIFAACLIYAWDQARPSRRARDVYRRVGWPMALAMAVNGGWSLFAQLERPLMVLFGIFLVGVAASLLAALRLFRDTPKVDIPGSAGAATGLLAGWVSVAIFANLSVALADLGYGETPSRVVQALVLLSAAGALACAVVRWTRGALTYAAAVAWALIALIVAHLTREAAPLWAVATGAWLVAIIATTIVSRRRSFGPAALRGLTPASALAEQAACARMAWRGVAPRDAPIRSARRGAQ